MDKRFAWSFLFTAWNMEPILKLHVRTETAPDGAA
jgi:hypothetical protein